MSILALLAIVAGAIGWLWIIALAINNEEYIWAAVSFFAFPLAVVYGMMNFDEAKIPLLCMLFGFLGRISISAITAGMAS